MEYIAVAMAVAVLVKLGVSDAFIDITGDNTTSLSWAQSKRFKVVPSQRAAIDFIAMGIFFDIEVWNATNLYVINYLEGWIQSTQNSRKRRLLQFPKIMSTPRYSLCVTP